MISNLLRKLWLQQFHYNSPQDSPLSRAHPLSRSLQDNLNLVREAFGRATDLVAREFTAGSGQIKACLIFIDGLVDKAAINEHIMKSLMLDARLTDPGLNMKKSEALPLIEKSLLSVAGARKAKTLEDVIDNVLCGGASKKSIPTPSWNPATWNSLLKTRPSLSSPLWAIPRSRTWRRPKCWRAG